MVDVQESVPSLAHLAGPCAQKKKRHGNGLDTVEGGGQTPHEGKFFSRMIQSRLLNMRCASIVEFRMTGGEVGN